MKKQLVFITTLLILFFLVSCSNRLDTTEDNLQSELTESFIPTTPSTTLVVTITPAMTSTVMPTLDPIEAEEVIEKLFLEPIDCPAPCFLGIIPGESTLAEAKTIFHYYQLSSGFETPYSYNVEYGPKDGLNFSITLAVVNQVVQSVMVEIIPREQDGDSRKWLAYSPDILLQRYGTPSSIEFHIGTGQNSESYSMILSFDSVELKAQYLSYDIEKQSNAYFICPLTNKMFDVRIWFGSNPINAAKPGLSIEEATGYSKDEFTSKMIGLNDTACFYLQLDNFK